MILGLTGYAGTGKDTLAKSLKLRHNFHRIAFADGVRNLAFELNPYIFELAMYLADAVHFYGWDAAKQYREVREFLQTLGHGARTHLGDDVWVMATRAPLIACLEEGKNVVFTDVRYPNEAAYVKSNGGKIVRIERPGIAAVNQHVTETNVDTMPIDATIVNDGTPTDLGRKATELVRQLGGN